MRIFYFVLMTRAAFIGGLVHAQNYPVKAIRLVVPQPPGGGNDVIARMISQKLSVALKQQIAVDKFAAGKDATALAILFARERLLKDGSRAGIQQALNDKSRHAQARGYLNELGAPVP